PVHLLGVVDEGHHGGGAAAAGGAEQHAVEVLGMAGDGLGGHAPAPGAAGHVAVQGIAVVPAAGDGLGGPGADVHGAVHVVLHLGRVVPEEAPVEHVALAPGVGAGHGEALQHRAAGGYPGVGGDGPGGAPHADEEVALLPTLVGELKAKVDPIRPRVVGDDMAVHLAVGDRCGERLGTVDHRAFGG